MLYQHLLSLISVVEIFLCAFFFWFCLRGDVAWKHKRGPPFALFVPLIYAPILPISKFFIINFQCSCFICHFFSLIWRFFYSGVVWFFIFYFSVRITLRKNPVLRDRLFYGVLAGAFGHGLYLMYPLLFNLLVLVDSSLSSQICNMHLNRFNFAFNLVSFFRLLDISFLLGTTAWKNDMV